VPARPYPVVLVLEGRPVLVVGGGQVAADKVAGLVAAGAVVHVVAPGVSEAVRAQPVTWEERAYRSGEAAAYRFVVACTDDPAVNERVFLDGEDAGVFVNAADDPAHCSATLPARLQRGRVLVTVSTGGSSPALASWLRDRLGEGLGPEVDELATLVAEARAELVERGERRSPADWRAALDSGILEMIRDGRRAEAEQQLRTALDLPGQPVAERP
jgi:precorrin-2 dehydrogenase / sirohydrochlorin ferrochelatase